MGTTAPPSPNADLRCCRRPGHNRKADRTVAAVVREAARRVAPLGEAFHLADLVVAAWQLDPARIGLAGYEAVYPDSNRVIAEVRDRRPGRVGRELERVGPNVFRLRSS